MTDPSDATDPAVAANAARIREIALGVARCSEVGLARGNRMHPCSQIVDLQSSDPLRYQVPEAWAGNLGAAGILFLSSNPSISESADHANAKDAENYPRESWTDEQIAEFMTKRFGDPSAAPATLEGKYLQIDGLYSAKKVNFWSRVRDRATNSLRTLVPTETSS